MDQSNLSVITPLQSSESCAKLFEALAKAQHLMRPAVMDKINPHFKSKYASLTSVQESYKTPLAEHGLSIIQQVFSYEDKYYIRTLICHSSGEWMANVLKLIVGRQDMQGLGSAITYARRYAVSSLVGVVDTEDDDANLAVESVKKVNVEPPKEFKPQVSQPAKSNLSDKQIDRYFAIANKSGWPPAMARAVVRAETGKGLSQCSRQDYDYICDYVMKHKFNETEKLRLESFVDVRPKADLGTARGGEPEAPWPETEFGPSINQDDQIPF